MKFVRAIWKLLVGIKDALVLIFMLLFFGLLYAGLSARPAPVGDGVLDARPQRQRRRAAGAAAMVGRRRRQPRSAQYRLRDLVAALDAAKDDDRVKAVALDLDGFTGGGQTAIGDLADAVRRVRAAGKPVVAYATGYTDDGYQLARRASEIWLNPLGAVRDRRAGRLEPLFQGPARQARGDRQRLSRRHLQVGGRAVHPQRHVARGAGELPGARPGACSKPGSRRVTQARPEGQRRPVPRAT